ncbi:hypothetical protein Plhal304r1_c051g0134501 [Plasmopara halstedii]
MHLIDRIKRAKHKEANNTSIIITGRFYRLQLLRYLVPINSVLSVQQGLVNSIIFIPDACWELVVGCDSHAEIVFAFIFATFIAHLQEVLSKGASNGTQIG